MEKKNTQHMLLGKAMQQFIRNGTLPDEVQDVLLRHFGEIEFVYTQRNRKAMDKIASKSEMDSHYNKKAKSHNGISARDIRSA